MNNYKNNPSDACLLIFKILPLYRFRGLVHEHHLKKSILKKSICMNTQKKTATQLVGMVTLVQKNSKTGICDFRNLLSPADIKAWNSIKNMTATEKVSLLEDLSLRYRVPVQPPEFKITGTEAYFEFSYSRIYELQEELLELGAIAKVINFSLD